MASATLLTRFAHFVLLKICKFAFTPGFSSLKLCGQDFPPRLFPNVANPTRP